MAKVKIDTAKIHKVADSIDLKYKFDYINHKIDNNLNIINGVNEFYDASWNKLIFLIGILGILLPIVIQYFQNRNLKLLLDEVTKRFDKSILKLQEENTVKLDAEIEKFENKFKVLEEQSIINSIKLKWSSNMLQARAYLDQKRYSPALILFLFSLNIELKNRDRLNNNIKTTLTHILQCLSRMNYEDFDNCVRKLDGNYEIILDEVFSCLEEQNDYDLYREIRIKIKNKIDQIKSNE